MITVRTAKEKNEKIPTVNPYSNRVIRIKTGTPMFPEEDADDGSNIFDSPSQIVNGNHRINLKREPQDEDGDGDNSFPSTSGMY